MKHKWLALALIVLAALGAFGVAFTSGHDPLVYATGAVIAATLIFVKRDWWAWAAIAAAALTLVVAVATSGGSGWYLVPSAFLTAVAGMLDLAAPRKVAA
ncbi:hypothetical protein [Tessaracoccus flavescens]|uniref:Uncharacterized protein n=1 Tax=Tessaracoccus flavescens TaxID=399497 RepID=A0A1Q2D0L7_9ACTN|nr:hypothetical protein [Tessaracoccus flavescens]AQP51970.1 hypothetical protein BW733_15210 [Tessaracoccus flavescens]